MVFRRISRLIDVFSVQTNKNPRTCLTRTSGIAVLKVLAKVVVLRTLYLPAGLSAHALPLRQLCAGGMQSLKAMTIG